MIAQRALRVYTEQVWIDQCWARKRYLARHGIYTGANNHGYSCPFLLDVVAQWYSAACFPLEHCQSHSCGILIIAFPKNLET